jgi:predicted nucleic acid-binding protein
MRNSPEEPDFLTKEAMMTMFMANALHNYSPVTGVTHADEAIGAEAAILAVALNEKTELVMMTPTKAIQVTFDGTAPVTGTHGVVFAANVTQTLNRKMADAMKWICAVAEEVGTITVQELTR